MTLRLRTWPSFICYVPRIFVAQWHRYGLAIAWLSVKSAVRLRWAYRHLPTHVDEPSPRDQFFRVLNMEQRSGDETL
jgi:hypothetical protein